MSDADLTGLLASIAEGDLDAVPILCDLLEERGDDGFNALKLIGERFPTTACIMISGDEQSGVATRAVAAGASGFIPKSQPVECIRDAIRRIMHGEVWLPADVDLSSVPSGETAELVSRMSTLTPQQVRVLMMLGEGLLNKQIAFKLGVSEATIKAHVSAILQKLGVDSRTQAVIAISKIGATGDWSRLPN